MTTEAEKVADLAVKAAARAQFVRSEDGREFLVTPKDCDAREVTDPLSLPLWEPTLTRQAVTLQTLDSLVDYCNRYKGENTVLFADIDANSIVAVIDYHAPEKAAHAAHRGSLKLAFSTEWTEWSRISGRLMEQLEFARFIEENGADVAAPIGAELLECVRDLQAHRKVILSRPSAPPAKTRTSNGARKPRPSPARAASRFRPSSSLAFPSILGSPMPICSPFCAGNSATAI